MVRLFEILGSKYAYDIHWLLCYQFLLGADYMKEIFFIFDSRRCFKKEPGLEIIFSLYGEKMFPVHKRTENRPA